MNKRDDCLSQEILLSSLKNNQFKFGDVPNNQTDALLEGKSPQKEKNEVPNSDRLLINPEFAESMDASDGSEMFSPEDRKIEEEATRLDY